MQELQVVKRDVQDLQQMYFLDNQGRHSRGTDEDGYFDFAGALYQVENNFTFEQNKTYIIKYLTNDGKPWKSGRTFTYRNGMDLSQHVYSHELSIEMYGEQALDYDDLHIYGIVVEEL
jgi:hypothetical protein